MDEVVMADKVDNEWQQFLDKVEEYAHHASDKWTTYTLLAYFLVKYRETTGVSFIFSPNKRGPTKSRELKQAATIWEMFNKGRYTKLASKEEKLAYKDQLVNILKAYIDWAFAVKFRGRQTTVTGLGIFAVANFMNEFLQWHKVSANQLPGRADPLPREFLDWVKANAADILTKQQLRVYGDLNALYNFVEACNSNRESIERIVLHKARDMGIMPATGKLRLRK